MDVGGFKLRFYYILVPLLDWWEQGPPCFQMGRCKLRKDLWGVEYTNVYKEPPTYYCRSTSNYNVDDGCCAMDTAEGENADLSSVHSPQLWAMLCTVAKRNRGVMFWYLLMGPNLLRYNYIYSCIIYITMYILNYPRTHTRQEWIIIWSGRNWILKHAD